MAESSPFIRYLLRIADDHLILAQRLSEMTGHAPMLEEELSLANVALDLLGQARSLFARAAELEGRGRTEDDLALMRLEHEYTNALLVEQPNDDFAYVVIRQLLFSAFAEPFWRAAADSKDEIFAAAAQKAVKESVYHLRYAREWTIRLGDGTDESRRRVTEALDDLWPYAGELFDRDDTVATVVESGLGPDPDRLRPLWDRTIDETLTAATLARPDAPWAPGGGRDGRHSEHLGHLLSELQYMQRAYPGMSW